jgi:hypothetical protein
MGRLASDNTAQIFLNGVNTGTGASGTTCCFDHFTSFQITSGFVQGVNRLDFVVTNEDCGPACVNPTGLRVEYRVAEVPEPATVTYFAVFGLLAFTLFRRDSSRINRTRPAPGTRHRMVQERTQIMNQLQIRS